MLLRNLAIKTPGTIFRKIWLALKALNHKMDKIDVALRENCLNTEFFQRQGYFNIKIPASNAFTKVCSSPTLVPHI